MDKFIKSLLVKLGKFSKKTPLPLLFLSFYALISGLGFIIQVISPYPISTLDIVFNLLMGGMGSLLLTIVAYIDRYQDKSGS